MPKWIYRPPGGGYKEAMGRSKEFESIAEMMSYLVEEQAGAFSVSDIEIKYHCFDIRNNTETFYVCIKRYGNEDYIKKHGTAQCIGYCMAK